MKKHILPLLLLALAPYAAHGSSLTGKDAYELCTQKLIGAPACNAYITGIWEGMLVQSYFTGTKPHLCAPDITTDQAREVFVGYLAKNMDKHDDLAIGLFIDSIAEVPCA